MLLFRVFTNLVSWCENDRYEGEASKASRCLQLRGQRHRRNDGDSTMQFGPMNQATHADGTMAMVEYILEYPSDLTQRMPAANVKIGDTSKAGILTPSSDAKFGFEGEMCWALGLLCSPVFVFDPLRPSHISIFGSLDTGNDAE